MSVEHIITRYSVQGDAQTIASLNKIAAAGQKAHASTHGGIIKAPAVGGGSGGGIGDGSAGFGAGVMGQLGALGGSAAATVAVGGAAAIGLLAVAAKAAAQSVWQLATTYGATENKLRASLKSLEGGFADETMKKLNAIAALPGITSNEAAAGYVQARNAGMGREMAMEMLKEIGNANALGGGDSEKLSRALLAMNQMFMKGKVSQEEMLQLSEAGIPMGKVLKQAFGTSDTEAIQKMGLSAEEAMGRMILALAKLPRASDSAANKMENLAVAVEKSLGVVGNGILESFAPAVDRLGASVMRMVDDGRMDALGKSIGDSWSALANAFTDNQVENMIYGVAGGLKVLAAVAQGFIHVMSNPITKKAMEIAADQVRAEAEAAIPSADWKIGGRKYKAWAQKRDAREKLNESIYVAPGEGVLDGSKPIDALKTAAQLMEEKATAGRASLGRGGASLSDIMTGGGDMGRLGVTAVELGAGGGGTKPAIVVQGGRELNEGVRMIVMSVIDQMQQGGQLAKA